MIDWRVPKLDDIPLLQRVSENNNFFANNYSALNSFLYSQKFNSRIAECGGWLFEKYFFDAKLYFSFPHKIDGLGTAEQKNPQTFKNAVNLILSEGQQEDTDFCFSNITLEEKTVLASLFPDASFTEQRDSGDYIYLTENLANLAGSKFSKKRNHIHQAQKNFDGISFVPLDLQNVNDALEIEEKWFAQNTESSEGQGSIQDLTYEKEIIKTVLVNFEFFCKQINLSGGVLYFNNTPASFCIASQLSQNVTDIHFEKCLSPFARGGAYALINNEFAKTVRTKYINREEDLGIAGLRKAKLSYYPELILEKFKVTLPRHCDKIMA